MVSKEALRLAEISEDLRDIEALYRQIHADWTRTKAKLKQLDEMKKSLMDEKDSLEQGQLIFSV